jgi:hypothetical protein
VLMWTSVIFDVWFTNADRWRSASSASVNIHIGHGFVPIVGRPTEARACTGVAVGAVRPDRRVSLHGSALTWKNVVTSRRTAHAVGVL